ncbi:MAG: DegT/DnrJ/EryC1/StrS family aminotransferase [Nitrospirae bacterium]|nr:DegT/DnrJ/EryC1/StrS family aminotransferase [Nitrospirota bacterium]
MGGRVPFIDLARQHGPLRAELWAAADGVLSRGDSILGEEVSAFEAEFAAYCGTRYAVGVGNGTDALILALRGLGIGAGDEVITVANSFMAPVAAIVRVGARPVFVDVRDDFNIDPEAVVKAITTRTRAILPVHLTGRPVDMNAVMAVAREYGLFVVEDAAQAVGARLGDRRVGSIGTVGCFSLHPLKNLGACGDGGIVTTHDEALYRFLVKGRNHGLRSPGECEFWSVNSRLDTVQAAWLRIKLRRLDGWIEERRRLASYYREVLSDVVKVPADRDHEFAVYQTFMVQADRRDALREHLSRTGVETRIHYPIPTHLQEAARELGYRPGDLPLTEALSGRILSLPIFPELTMEERETVVARIRRFYRGSRSAVGMPGRKARSRAVDASGRQPEQPPR